MEMAAAANFADFSSFDSPAPPLGPVLSAPILSTVSAT